MQIDLDIHKPLRSTINFLCDGGKQILVEVRYERLIDFCHACGRIGHKNPNCTYDKEKKGLEDEDNPIGPWLKFEASLIPSMKAEFLLFTVILYESIWMARNKLNLGISPPSTQQLVLFVSRKCKNHWLAMAQTAQGKTQSPKAWKPPPENWTKVNVDAAFTNGLAYTGMVLRNSNGSFLHAAAYNHHCLDPLSAECLAILDACKTLEILNYKSVIIESDSLNAISFINVDSSNCFWTAAPLVEKIRRYKHKWKAWNFKFISRKLMVPPMN
ncbi:hypothetical protein CASFOL_008537 [Castilleja foliolosa]|uniref:CCHC-type domain-containing protein n=1 Tax=Castilleja foliolosa TaxID=1961234 RepID=A0ABD3E397_9LAMI